MGSTVLVYLSHNRGPKLQELLLNLVVYCYIQRIFDKGAGFSTGSYIMASAVSLISGCRVFVTDDLSSGGGPLHLLE